MREPALEMLDKAKRDSLFCYMRTEKEYRINFIYYTVVSIQVYKYAPASRARRAGELPPISVDLLSRSLKI